MKFTRLAAVAALVGSAAAEWEIFSPSTDVWWVAKTENTISWSCKDPTAIAHPPFEILLVNSDPKVPKSPIPILTSGMQIINTDCYGTATTDQLNAAPGTGYTIQFANAWNFTEVFVSSKPFEIKRLGAIYPTTTPGTDAASPSTKTFGTHTAFASTTTPGTDAASPSATIPGTDAAYQSTTTSGANVAATSSTGSNNSKPNGAVGMSMKAVGVVGAVAGASVLGLVM